MKKRNIYIIVMICIACAIAISGNISRAKKEQQKLQMEMAVKEATILKSLMRSELRKKTPDFNKLLNQVEISRIAILGDNSPSSHALAGAFQQLMVEHIELLRDTSKGDTLSAMTRLDRFEFKDASDLISIMVAHRIYMSDTEKLLVYLKNQNTHMGKVLSEHNVSPELAKIFISSSMDERETNMRRLVTTTKTTRLRMDIIDMLQKNPDKWSIKNGDISISSQELVNDFNNKNAQIEEELKTAGI